MTKQTAANNADIARVKKAMNAKIFIRYSEIYNQGAPWSKGKETADAYLSQFFRAGIETVEDFHKRHEAV